VVSFTPRPLYQRERAPGTHCIKGWVDPRAGLDNMEKLKFLTLPGLEPRPLSRPARSQSLYRLRYHGSHREGRGELERDKKETLWEEEGIENFSSIGMHKVKPVPEKDGDGGILSRLKTLLLRPCLLSMRCDSRHECMWSKIPPPFLTPREATNVPPPRHSVCFSQCFVVLFYAPTKHPTSGLPAPTHPN
jgi:hypothetical protein